MQNNKLKFGMDKVKKYSLLLVTGIMLFLTGCSKDGGVQLVITDNISLLANKNINSNVLHQTMNYNIVDASREMRFIAGLSMGGFGASYYTFTHPNKFMYCYSMSGAVEGIGSPLTPSISGLISGYDPFVELPGYTLDCGTSDFLVYKSNQSVHEELSSIGFEHEYIAREEVHDWVFWQKSLEIALERIGQYLN